MTTPLQLTLLPGVGADCRLFEPQVSAFPDLVVPPWIAPERGETLAHYAARFAESLSPRRPVILGGVSFGGMVAYEMARHLRPEAVVLIASCRSGRVFRPTVRRLRSPIGWLPSSAFGLAKWISPLAVRTFVGLTPQQRRLCVEMFRDTDSRFIRWALTAILGWEPLPLEAIPVFQIHGEKDRAIPASRVEADEIVPGGGHLINLTHAERVNDFLRGAIGDRNSREFRPRDV